MYGAAGGQTYKKKRKCRRQHKDLLEDVSRVGVAAGIKQDLKPQEIPVFASALVREDAASLVEDNHSIYGLWLSCLERTRLAIGSINKANDSIVGSFDEIFRLTCRVRDPDESNRVRLRFAYIQLVQAIGHYRALINEQRVKGIFNSKTSQGNVTIAINMYCTAKGENSEKFRQTLSEHICGGRRFSCLVDISPLQLSLYTQLAEKIV
jgi:hypothetical protein